jgi:uncharacterized protein (DUF433 family)
MMFHKTSKSETRMTQYALDLPDSEFPSITYRRGASGTLSPILRGTGIRVQTIVLASHSNTPDQIAEDYDLPFAQVQEALGFYNAHRVEIDAHIQAETALEPKDK